MGSDKRTLRWCAEHEEPAWVYDDGSEWCWYDSIVEASNPHQIVNLPQDDEIERLRSALAIASGMISTMPQYEHEHPESIMEMLLEEARRG